MKILLVTALILSPLIISKILEYVLKIVYKNQILKGTKLKVSTKEFARKILEKENLTVQIRLIQGCLTDAYDSENNVLYLSESTTYSTSPAAYAITSHEIGHILQHRDHFKPEMLRTSLQGFIYFLGIISTTLILVSLIIPEWLWASYLGWSSLMLYVFINICTIKAEIDATNRAKGILEKINLSAEDRNICYKVLCMCYWTYIVTMFSNLSIILLLLFSKISSKN